MNDEKLALIAKALGHPVRVQILRMLAGQQECMGVQLFGSLPLAQSTVSQHLSLLREAGLVTSHAVGQGHVYCLSHQMVGEFNAAVDDIVSNAPACCTNGMEKS